MQTEEVKQKKLFNYLSQASQKAYRDEYLITNDVLCKSQTRARMLELYLEEKVPGPISPVKKIIKIIKFYLKNAVWFLLYLLTGLAHFFSGQKCQVAKKTELHALDVYFIVPEILKKNEFIDNYLSGLTQVLDKRNKDYFYIPRWFGSLSPFDFFKVFRIIKKCKHPVLTEFQILEWSDYGRVLLYLIAYPFHVRNFAQGLGCSEEDRILSFALWETLDTVTMRNYLRYLFGKKIACLRDRKVKCISWFENQAINKTLYRGLRYVPGKIKIYGAQLFLKPSTLMNIIPDESEIPFGVLPDKILVNGRDYSLNLKHISEEVGPSLRYSKLFQTQADPSNGDVILVLLPYWDHAIRIILSLLKEIKWPALVMIKFHPAVKKGDYSTQIPSEFLVTDEDLYVLFKRARMAVGCSTGVLVEAMCLGIPVVDIVTPKQFVHNYMPEQGRGVLWDKAVNEEDINLLFRRFEEVLRVNPSLFKDTGLKMRDMLFCKPTEEQVVRAFDLA
jgi:hypothetical protein